VIGNHLSVQIQAKEINLTIVWIIIVIILVLLVIGLARRVL
jgi:hypothetical protein